MRCTLMCASPRAWCESCAVLLPAVSLPPRVLAEDTCLPPYGTGPYSKYDPVARTYQVKLCHFSTYGFFFQSPPRAVIDAPANVQWRAGGVGVTIAVNGSASHDTDTDLPVSYLWTITPPGSQDVADVQVAPAGGLTAPSFTITNPVPGTYSLQLTVKDVDAGVGSALVDVVVNQQPVASLVIDTSTAATGRYGLSCAGSSDAEDPLTALSITAASTVTALVANELMLEAERKQQE